MHNIESVPARVSKGVYEALKEIRRAIDTTIDPILLTWDGILELMMDFYDTKKKDKKIKEITVEHIKGVITDITEIKLNRDSILRLQMIQQRLINQSKNPEIVINDTLGYLCDIVSTFAAEFMSDVQIAMAAAIEASTQWKKNK